MVEKQDISKVDGGSAEYAKKVRDIKDATLQLSRVAMSYAAGKATIADLCDSAETFARLSKWPEAKFGPDEEGPI
jgi:hypothetical protein